MCHKNEYIEIEDASVIQCAISMEQPAKVSRDATASIYLTGCVNEARIQYQ